MLPPLAAALMKFSQEYEYSWHTPGHTGGTAFLKSPVGRIFFDYFGENLLRSDLSISVGALGSLLDHTGPIGEHEKYAARVFGAHRTYCVTNGTSMSNRVIFMAAVGRNQIAFCDRNCHKSIEHSLVMTGRHPDLSRSAAQSLRDHRAHPAGAAQEGGDQGRDQGEPAGLERGIDPSAGVLGGHQLHLRRAVLQRTARGGAARSERRPDSLRRGLVRLRPLQPAVPGSSCHARRPEGSQGPDGLRHALHAQVAGGALPGVVSCTSATAAAPFRTRGSTSRS